MTTIEQSIEVEVPVTTAYNQWTQFEEFPRFMDGVEQVRQLDDKHLHWKTRIAGVEREFDAEITEQHPDERIAWCSIEGPRQAGVVTFHRLDAARTKVMLQMDFEPEGIVEQAGDKLGVVRSRVSGDLERFKEFIEERGAETGAWRGDVPPARDAGTGPGGGMSGGMSGGMTGGATGGMTGGMTGGVSGGDTPMGGPTPGMP